MNLVDAILQQNPQKVRELIAAGADVNEIDVYGYPPIIEAAIVDDANITAILLEQGADVNAQDLTGGTALHWAVDNNNLDLCRLLLTHQANPNAYNYSAQPILVKPLLRNQKALKELLYQYRADLKFAQDYINAKLIGHRFELQGTIDIVDADNTFIELQYDGFFLEFTLDLLKHSLHRYRNNYAARELRDYFKHLQTIIFSLSVANELIKYQHYRIDRAHFQSHIQSLLNTDPLIIPLSYAGHAISAIKYGNRLAICDRGERSKTHATVEIFTIHNMQAFSAEFYHFLFYEKLPKGFMTRGIYKTLDLELIDSLPLPPQLIGNCSWANIEAIVPSMLYLLCENKQQAMHFYQQWLRWDQDMALHECIESFYYASNAAKASKAAILAAVLFQTCDFHQPKDLDRAQKMMPILSLSQFRYILQSYTEVFRYQAPEKWENFRKILHLYDVELE
jgi:hypothetical protein